MIEHEALEKEATNIVDMLRDKGFNIDDIFALLRQIQAEVLRRTVV